MNKIIVSEYEKTYENIQGFLSITTDTSHIHLNGNNNITHFDLKKECTITLEENSSLTLTNTWAEKIEEKKITIYCQKNTTLNCQFYIDVNECCNITLDTNLLKDNICAHILFHVVTEQEETCNIKTTGYIAKDTKENTFLEEIKGLTFDHSMITCMPELIVDSLDVVANHNATIKKIEDEELFYLESKGLDENDSKDLIKKGFLTEK